ncbi:MAG: hypothetical protein AAGD14_17245 [Planctomycetota bacterium]
MTARSRSEPATLRIRAADEGTEIFVMDAGLKRVAIGLGDLEEQVEPGLYKVRFRSGAAQHDQLVDATKPGSSVVVDGPPIQFRSAVPLVETETTHEYQQGPAYDVSRTAPLARDAGGRLYLFVREVREDRDFIVPGLTVHRLDGSEIATLGEGVENLHGRWASLHLELDPGTYALRVQSPPLGEYEIFVTASPGWQTQVFFAMEDFWREGEPVRAPSLRTASVLMAEAHRGFDPGDERVRVCELARQALAQGRDVVSRNVMQKLLHGKFEAPMLGILAANLLLRRHRPNWELLRTVCGNLYNVLGAHPDVDALTLVVRGWEGSRIDAFKTPPSLRRSWDHIVQASRRRATLVPSGSPLAAIAEELVLAGPWLMHRIGGRVREQRPERVSLAAAVRAMHRLIAVPSETLEALVRQSRSEEGTLSSLERNVLGAALGHARAMDIRAELDAKVDADTELRGLLRAISAPTYAIADAVMSLVRKLGV